MHLDGYDQPGKNAGDPDPDKLIPVPQPPNASVALALGIGLWCLLLGSGYVIFAYWPF